MKKFLLAAAACAAMCMPLAAGNDACSGDAAFQNAVSYDLQITYKASNFTKRESHLAEFSGAFTRNGNGVNACVKYDNLVFNQYLRDSTGNDSVVTTSTKLMNNYLSQLVKSDILAESHPFTINPEGRASGEAVKPVDKNASGKDRRAAMLLPWVRNMYCADYSAGVVSPLIFRQLGSLSSLKVGDTLSVVSQNVGALRGCFSTTLKCVEKSAGVFKFSVKGTVGGCDGVACQLLQSGQRLALYDVDGSLEGSLVVEGRSGVVSSGSLKVRLKANGQTTTTKLHNPVGDKYPLEVEQSFNILGSSDK